MQHLDSRLSAIAELFTPGGRGIDVGTDHGYLPVALVQAGKAAHFIASDLRPGPLQSARANIRENGLADRIETRLADGLDLAEYRRRGGAEFTAHQQAFLEHCARAGYLTLTPDHIALTPLGMIVQNSILEELI